MPAFRPAMAGLLTVLKEKHVRQRVARGKDILSVSVCVRLWLIKDSACIMIAADRTRI
jgi:hypothetical protein